MTLPTRSSLSARRLKWLALFALDSALLFAQSPKPTFSSPRRTVAAATNTPRGLRVSLQNGALTVQVEDASLSDVLRAIARVCGATVELSPSAANERIAASLGPAPVDQVIASLLNGSPFDYVLINRADQPSVLQSMMVRDKADTSVAAASGLSQAGSVVPPPPPADAQADDSDFEPPTPEVSGEAPPPTEEAPAQEGPGQNQQGPYAEQQPENQPPPKTPEQLLEELKRLQEQQRQQGQPLPPPQVQDAPMPQ